MKIKWMGHACFLITSEGGTKILTDPFDESVGYELPEVDADIVSVSHNHHDHNNTGVVKGNFKVFNKAGSFTEKDIEITGLKSFHDESGGSKRGENLIFCFRVDGLNICHLGDLGHVPTQELVDAAGPVDVLLIPVGGTYTIDAQGACAVMKMFKPRITIPMHFKTEVLGFPIDGVNRFLSLAGGGERVGKQEIEINKDNIESFSNIIVLDYK